MKSMSEFQTRKVYEQCLKESCKKCEEKNVWYASVCRWQSQYDKPDDVVFIIEMNELFDEFKLDMQLERPKEVKNFTIFLKLYLKFSALYSNQMSGMMVIYRS